MSSQPVHDVIVIGSGPAGYTAAIYTARAELKPLVFEGTSFGGALMTTTEVENYPGFRNGIQGPELMEEMREQALRFGADLQMEDVESVSLHGPVKEVVTAGGQTHRARAVILAMGAAARYLGVPGEQELLGRVGPDGPATVTESDPSEPLSIYEIPPDAAGNYLLDLGLTLSAH